MAINTAPRTGPEADRFGLGLRGWLALLTLCGATFMTGLDYSIIVVAMPEIGDDLGFADAGSLQWVATACVLPTAALLPLSGRISDLIGRRKLFILGVATFMVISLLAALANSPATLVAARAGQGIAAAAIVATAMALLTATFPEGPQRSRALGINGALLSLGFTTGAIGGGVITSGLSWRATMLLLAVLGAVVLAGALTALPNTDERGSARLDVPGAVLASAGLFALVYAIETVGRDGIARPVIIAGVAAIVLLGGFFAVEARHRAPLVPLAMLNRPTVKWGFLAGVITFGMCAGATMMLSLYMQDVLGYSPLASGFGFIALGGAAMIAGSLAPRILDGRGVGFGLITGFVAQAAGTGALVFLPAGGNLALLLIGSGLMGFGHVLAVVSVVTTITSGISAEEYGVAGALAQMPQFVGAVGVGLLAAIATSTDGGVLAGIRAAFVAAAVISLLGACLAATLLRAPSKRAI